MDKLRSFFGLPTNRSYTKIPANDFSDQETSITGAIGEEPVSLRLDNKDQKKQEPHIDQIRYETGFNNKFDFSKTVRSESSSVSTSLLSKMPKFSFFGEASKNRDKSSRSFLSGLGKLFSRDVSRSVLTQEDFQGKELNSNRPSENTPLLKKTPK